MAALASCTSKIDDERDLEALLKAFGSVASLEVIAAAYFQAKCNVDDAAEIIHEMQQNTSRSVSYASEEGLSATSSESLADSVSHLLRPKKSSASMGTVSGIIGKDYVRSRPLVNEQCTTKKPVKIDMKQWPMSEISSQEESSCTQAGSCTMQNDVEQFLFHMLGDGFKLDMNVIRDVLGLCGYDVKKSMEKLLDLSASKFNTSDGIVERESGKPEEKCMNLESHSRKGKSQQVDPLEINRTSEMSKADKNRHDLQKEVLQALFNVPERPKEVKTTRPLGQVRSTAFGKPVVEPLPDSTIDYVIVSAETQKSTECESEDDEDRFSFLRKAVKEHWNTMKEYYKAAVDAFANGDLARAYKLMEEGHSYGKKAREADEKSAQNLIEGNEYNCSTIVSLNMVECKPKEAVDRLRFHLTMLSGIGSIEYLKIITGSDDGNARKGSRKQRIRNLLEREAIKWTEEQNGELLLIRVDDINPKQLSFAKQQK